MTSGRAGRLPRDARRIQLLAAAREVFVEQGYHAAGMDDIAERAGVSKPVLYQHFPGKYELYVALLDRAVEALLTSVLEAMQTPADNRERVRATIQAYFAFVAGEGAYRLVFESDLANDVLVGDRIASVQRRCARVLAELLRQDTDLADEEARLLATGVVGMAQVCAREWAEHEDSVPLEEAVKLVATLVWRGMRGLPRQDSDA